MFRKLKNDQSGIILVAVIIITIVMSILAAGLLALDVSRVKSGERMKRSMVAEYFAREILWTVYANNLNSLPITPTVARTIDGDYYHATITDLGGSPTQYDITVTYDSL